MRRISRLKRIRQARKKTGRKTFSYTIALTPEQIQWLTERYTNSSKLIRRLLDDHIESMDKVEPDRVKLGYKLKRLLGEKEAKEEEKDSYERQHFKDSHNWFSADRKDKFLRRFLETPADQIEISFPRPHEQYPQLWVTLPGEDEVDVTDFGISAREKDRQKILDVLRRKALEAKTDKDYKNRMDALKREKDVYDKIVAAFDENIQLLDEEINEIRHKINLLNKQRNSVV